MKPYGEENKNDAVRILNRRTKNNGHGRYADKMTLEAWRNLKRGPKKTARQQAKKELRQTT